MLFIPPSVTPASIYDDRLYVRFGRFVLQLEEDVCVSALETWGMWFAVDFRVLMEGFIVLCCAACVAQEQGGWGGKLFM